MTVSARQTLRDALMRVHLRVTLFAVGMAGLTVLVAGFGTMAGYVRQNLVLAARTASYSVAPAMVFNDAEAAREALAPLAANEGVTEISVLRPDGRVFVSVAHLGPRDGVADWLVGRRLAEEPVTQQNRIVGRVVVRGNGSAMARYVRSGLLGALACLVLTGLATWLLAMRLQDKIVDQLRRIALVAHEVRMHRNFDQRVPSANIEEIATLSDDFNALLDELYGWHTRISRENASLSHQAAHDPLTGLLNRSGFEQRLDAVLAAARMNGERFAVLYLDGDQFKSINDRHGHAIGDHVLCDFAAKLRGSIKPGDFAARIGGDEFAIVAVPPSDANEAARIVEAIAIHFAQPTILPSGGAIDANISCGVAIYPDDGDDAATLIRKADKAMYRAKSLRWEHHIHRREAS